jgi:ElaA protein
MYFYDITLCMQILVKHFSDLTLEELYALLRLRAEVFVVEQNCVYQDLDNLDQDAHHLLGYEGETIIATARILKPGSHYTIPAIGRVVTAQSHRSQGAGKAVFQAAVDETKRLFPQQNIKIMAQTYLIKFYSAFGFVVVSEEFLEDGIPHLEMELRFF